MMSPVDVTIDSEFFADKAYLSLISVTILIVGFDSWYELESKSLSAASLLKSSILLLSILVCD